MYPLPCSKEVVCKSNRATTVNASHAAVAAKIGKVFRETLNGSNGGRMVATVTKVRSHPQQSTSPRLMDLVLISLGISGISGNNPNRANFFCNVFGVGSTVSGVKRRIDTWIEEQQRKLVPEGSSKVTDSQG